MEDEPDREDLRLPREVKINLGMFLGSLALTGISVGLAAFNVDTGDFEYLALGAVIPTVFYGNKFFKSLAEW